MVHLVVWVALFLSVLNGLLFTVVLLRSSGTQAAAVGDAAAGGFFSKSVAAFFTSSLSIAFLLIALVAAGLDKT